MLIFINRIKKIKASYLARITWHIDSHNGHGDKMKKLLLASALLLSTGVAQATDSVRWDMASVSLQSVEIDGDKMKGYGLAATTLLNENVIIAGHYSTIFDDMMFFGTKLEIELSTMGLGLGYRHAISDKTDFYGIVSYETIKADVSSGGYSDDASESGVGLEVGIRSLMSEQFELIGSLKNVSIEDESELSVDVTAMLHMSDSFSIFVGAGKADDATSMNAGVSLFF